jgi:hypothetical protein
MFDNMIPNADKLAEINKQMIGSFAQLSEIAATAQSKIASQQMAAFEANMGAASKVMEAITAGKQPADVYAVQVETAQSLAEGMMGSARDFWEVQTEARDQMAALWTTQTEAATQPTKPAARAKKTA